MTRQEELGALGAEWDAEVTAYETEATRLETEIVKLKTDLALAQASGVAKDAEIARLMTEVARLTALLAAVPAPAPVPTPVPAPIPPALSLFPFHDALMAARVGIQIDRERQYTQSEIDAMASVCGHFRIAGWPPYPLMPDPTVGQARFMATIDRCIKTGRPVVITALGSGYIYDAGKDAVSMARVPLKNGDSVAVAQARAHMVGWAKLILARGWNAAQVALEPYNEPMVSYGAAQWWSNLNADRLAIRAVAPNLAIAAMCKAFVPMANTGVQLAGEWDWVGGLAAVGSMPDPLVFYPSHEYQRMRTTWQGTGIGGAAAGSVPYPGSGMDVAFIAARVKRFDDWLTSKSLRGWIGEAGACRYLPGGQYGAQRVLLEHDIIAASRARGIPICIFDDGRADLTPQQPAGGWFSHMTGSAGSASIHPAFHANFAIV